VIILVENKILNRDVKCCVSYWGKSFKVSDRVLVIVSPTARAPQKRGVKYYELSYRWATVAEAATVVCYCRGSTHKFMVWLLTLLFIYKQMSGVRH
jgi:hypothetical protein